MRKVHVAKQSAATAAAAAAVISASLQAVMVPLCNPTMPPEVKVVAINRGRRSFSVVVRPLCFEGFYTEMVFTLHARHMKKSNSLAPLVTKPAEVQTARLMVNVSDPRNLTLTIDNLTNDGLYHLALTIENAVGSTECPVPPCLLDYEHDLADRLKMIERNLRKVYNIPRCRRESMMVF